MKQLQQKINYQFKNQALLKQSLIHRSYLNENHSDLNSNERLEFLGDAVLELWVSRQLFKLFPKLAEGSLTNLRALIVCTQNLSLIATNIDLGQHILLSRGEETHGGRHNQSILADSLESLIGAIFLDSSFTKTNTVLHHLFDSNITQISQQKIYKDPKSLFQEIAQDQHGITPHYQIIKEIGPDHQKHFEAAVFIDNKQIAHGTGNSKQRAEEAAAIAGIKILKPNSKKTKITV